MKPLACRKCNAVLGTLCPRGQSLRSGGLMLRSRAVVTCVGCGHKHSFRPSPADSRPRGQGIARPAH